MRQNVPPFSKFFFILPKSLLSLRMNSQTSFNMIDLKEIHTEKMNLHETFVQHEEIDYGTTIYSTR